MKYLFFNDYDFSFFADYYIIKTLLLRKDKPGDNRIEYFTNLFCFNDIYSKAAEFCITQPSNRYILEYTRFTPVEALIVCTEISDRSGNDIGEFNENGF